MSILNSKVTILGRNDISFRSESNYYNYDIPTIVVIGSTEKAENEIKNPKPPF